MSEYTVKTARDPGFDFEAERRITEESWQPFMLEDPVGNQYFWRLYEVFPDFQFMMFDGDTPIAVGNSIPMVWNLDDATLLDEGWDWALSSGFVGKERGITPTTACALSITITRSHLGKGVSKQAVLTMKAIAEQQGMNALIAPVRPNQKARYPLTPMERYITWTQDDGAPFDAWLRTHWRVGGRIVKVAPRAMVIPGTVVQWEGWTGLKFPENGEYVVTGALNPVTADVERDLITYVEPNVWVHHPIKSP